MCDVLTTRRRRLSGYLLFPLLLLTAFFGGLWSHFITRNAVLPVRIILFGVAPLCVLFSVFVRIRYKNIRCHPNFVMLTTWRQAIENEVSLVFPHIVCCTLAPRYLRIRVSCRSRAVIHSRIPSFSQVCSVRWPNRRYRAAMLLARPSPTLALVSATYPPKQIQWRIQNCKDMHMRAIGKSQ